MSPSLSIIVPVYNVEKYLPKCIDGILAQTFTDFELLLVDDGSTDSSGRICDAYAATDSRIRVTHKSNGGVSSARNVALENVTGGVKWITFIDSDDFVANDYIQNLLKQTKEDSELDFVQGGCTNYRDSSSTYDIEQEYESVISNDKADLLERMRGLLHSKLFLAALIEKIGLRFDERIRIAEDMIFTIEYIRHVNKYAFCSERGYYYRRHSSSATQSQKREYAEMLVGFRLFYKVVTDYKNAHSIRRSEVRDKQLSRYVLNTMFALYRNAYSRKERLNRLRTDFTRQDLSLLKHGNPNKVSNILAKLLRYRQYILFDLIVWGLFTIRKRG